MGERSAERLRERVLERSPDLQRVGATQRRRDGEADVVVRLGERQVQSLSCLS